MLTVSVVAMTLRIRRSLEAEAECWVSVDAASCGGALGRGGWGWDGVVSTGVGFEGRLIIVIVEGGGTAGLRGLATGTAKTILGLGDFLDRRILTCTQKYKRRKCLKQCNAPTSAMPITSSDLNCSRLEQYHGPILVSHDIMMV